jgi:hypothetical protein
MSKIYLGYKALLSFAYIRSRIWRGFELLGQNELSVPGDAQVILFILVHDHDFVAPLGQKRAFDPPFLA